VKGKRCVDIKCWRYVQGPSIAAHDAKNSTEPNDHLLVTGSRLALHTQNIKTSFRLECNEAELGYAALLNNVRSISWLRQVLQRVAAVASSYREGVYCLRM
jgi:hypothetical protein